MPRQDVLIMAMTRMRSGICTAGFINQPHARSRLQWVRPVKEHGTLLLGDMTTLDGRTVEMGDVISLNLLQPRPDPVHAEDWLTDFVYERPRLLRRLEGERRAGFLADYLDDDPAEVLLAHSRSLCLIRPDALWADFSLDAYSGKYQARLGFRLDGLDYERANSARGLPVTDLKWRALGRNWLAEDGSYKIQLDQDRLHQRLEADKIYLSIGLSRTFQGVVWALIVGVHPVPDYAAAIDYQRL